MGKKCVKKCVNKSGSSNDNTQVERFNRLLKASIQNAMIEGKRSLKETTLELLLPYRSTPHQTTGFSPSELLHRRQMRTKLDVQGRMPVKSGQTIPRWSKKRSNKNKNKERLKSTLMRKEKLEHPDFVKGTM